VAGGGATINVFMSSRVSDRKWRVMAYSSSEAGNDPEDQDMVQACAVCATVNP